MTNKYSQIIIATDSQIKNIIKANLWLLLYYVLTNVLFDQKNMEKTSMKKYPEPNIPNILLNQNIFQMLFHKIKKLWLIIFFVSFVLIWSCNDKNEDAITMEFKETHCANPWTAAPGSDDYIVVVRDYLEENGITVYSIFIERFDPNEGEICTACHCLTGRMIVVSIPDTDKKKAEEMGFTLQ